MNSIVYHWVKNGKFETKKIYFEIVTKEGKEPRLTSNQGRQGTNAYLEGKEGPDIQGRTKKTREDHTFKEGPRKT